MKLGVSFKQGVFIAVWVIHFLFLHGSTAKDYIERAGIVIFFIYLPIVGYNIMRVKDGIKTRFNIANREITASFIKKA